MNRHALATAPVLILPGPVSAADCEPVRDVFQSLAARDSHVRTVMMKGAVMEMRGRTDARNLNADGERNAIPGGPAMRQQTLAQIMPDASAPTD